MAERSFSVEIDNLRLGEGKEFRGEGILAVAKALLQSGVSYVGGYQGAPVSHLMDVFADAEDVLEELGVHFENCASEAGAAAMLGASINYPLRGAVTWKSTVGTNVASDALSNLASAGVKGGTLIILGEDYGEGASIIQERSHAFATKSQMWLLDPRPNLPSMVEMVEKGFELSEASSTPVMLEMRIRACHVYGRFKTKENKAGEISRLAPLEEAEFDYGRICLPPSTYVQEQDKVNRRMPAALEYIAKNKLNERMGEAGDVGIIMQGGLFNGVNRALQQLGLSDAHGNSKLPLFVLNVTYPLVPEEISEFCKDKKSVLVIEEGQPDYLAQNIKAILRDAGEETLIHGKNYLPLAGEYTGQVLFDGLAKFLLDTPSACLDLSALKSLHSNTKDQIAKAISAFQDPLPIRPPGFCIGCPERPVFTAMKLVERQVGKFHVSADIGCHTFATLPPFNIGNTVMGYGLGLSGSSGIAPLIKKRTASIMGDGGFWHNGLTSGVANAVFNKDDSVLVILKNGYTAATGHQDIPTSKSDRIDREANLDMTLALKAMGVKWIKTINSYSVAEMAHTFRDAMTTDKDGLKVIIADGECMLAVQRRKKPEIAKKLKSGDRVVKSVFAVDDTLCTGDHSCIRLSACPTLTIKENPDPLRKDPVAHVEQGCVGCGNCGETAHAASLCPSFYEIRTISNPSKWERLMDRVRRTFIRPRRGKTYEAAVNG
ncbi:thiamine pyrophosphate-dependent enzyme [Sneathiella aquimaris]|uniref:thiamine pyrophosphate-dependent enzyme n=1 Tax=Sneathiella aquimaris TaxID=2599305 RepID=UPI001469C4B4|nr:indolepyruvate ferredoxin oxidoreductase subunit alpha [Sneathiella aquimaris]